MPYGKMGKPVTGSQKRQGYSKRNVIMPKAKSTPIMNGGSKWTESRIKSGARNMIKSAMKKSSSTKSVGFDY